MGVGSRVADGKERNIVVGNGIGSRRALSGVIGGEGLQCAVSRTDREGGVKGVDLMGINPECATLTVVLPENVHSRRAFTASSSSIACKHARASLRACKVNLQSCGRTAHALFAA